MWSSRSTAKFIISWSFAGSWKEKGHHFHCHADTEVLVHGYEEWGTRLVHRLRGMYGFVIWDKANRRLFGARDMFGIKPFYYSPLPAAKGFCSAAKSKAF